MDADCRGIISENSLKIPNCRAALKSLLLARYWLTWRVFERGYSLLTSQPGLTRICDASNELNTETCSSVFQRRGAFRFFHETRNYYTHRRCFVIICFVVLRAIRAFEATAGENEGEQEVR